MITANPSDNSVLLVSEKIKQMLVCIFRLVFQTDRFLSTVHLKRQQSSTFRQLTYQHVSRGLLGVSRELL